MCSNDSGRNRVQSFFSKNLKAQSLGSQQADEPLASRRRQCLPLQWKRSPSGRDGSELSDAFPRLDKTGSG